MCGLGYHCSGQPPLSGYAAWRHYNRDGKGGSTSTGFYLKLKKEKKEKVLSNQVLYFSQSIGD